jgi:hypothetical protein
MKRILALALMSALVVNVAGASAQSNGVISGTVSASTGRPLSGITMQLVDAGGTPVGKPVTTARDGAFSFPPVAYDTYTLQCLQNAKVVGTSSVILKAATESVKMTCAIDVAAWWRGSGVVTGLVAAAAAVGTAAVVAVAGDASGSR